MNAIAEETRMAVVAVIGVQHDVTQLMYNRVKRPLLVERSLQIDLE